jgi:hypothetical protein
MARKAAAPETKLGDEAQRIAAEAAHRIEAAVQEGLAKLRAQSKVYAETAPANSLTRPRNTPPSASASGPWPPRASPWASAW